jgi:RHS repeat-associated protein
VGYPYEPNGGVPGDTVRYTYDQLGNLLSVTNLNGSIVRTYYGDRSVESKKTNMTFPDSVNYQYDQTGARTRMSHTGNGGSGTTNVTDVVTYSYAATTGDLLSSTVNWGAPANLTRTVSFLWDALDRRRQVTYPNNTVAKYRYDGGSRVRRIVATNPATPSTGDRFDFTFRADSIDAAGRALHERLTCPSYVAPDPTLGYACGGGGTLSRASRYNRFNQLVFQNAGIPDSFDFDASDNMVFHRTGSQSPHWYRISAHTNQIFSDSVAGSPSASVVGFGFDSAGGRQVEGTPTSLIRAYYYDGMGRASGMVDSQHPGTTRATCIGYDADGNIQLPCDAAVNRLAYDGANVSGVTALRYWSFVHGPGLDDPLVGLYRDRTQSTVFKEWYWITDGRGRQFATGAADGTLGSIPSTEYTDNGGSYAGGTQNAATFSADRFASPVLPGLSFFRNRVYDQGTGRWTQEDPIGVAGGLNLYAFNGNNPAAYTDPFGLCPWCIAAGVVLEEAARGAIVGAAVGAIEQVGLNKLQGRSLLEGVGHSALIGAGVGAVTGGLGSAVRIARTVGLAKVATGLEDAAVVSRAEAEAAGELHVGSERVDMLERGTTQVKGVRNPTTGAKYRPEPGEGHVNLQNDQGGNVHVHFPEP